MPIVHEMRSPGKEKDLEKHISRARALQNKNTEPLAIFWLVRPILAALAPENVILRRSDTLIPRTGTRILTTLHDRRAQFH